MFSPTDRKFTALKMKSGGSYHIHHIAGINQYEGIVETRNAIIRSDSAGSIICRVIKSNNFNSFDLLPVIQVKFSQMANSEDADFKHGNKDTAPLVMEISYWI